MRVQDIMSRHVIRVSPEESVEVAARLLSRHNVGVLPVCSADGTLRGMLTDRDIVLRCVATGTAPSQITVAQVMSRRVISARAEDYTQTAAGLMAREQVRRLPVTQNGRLVGMLSLGDLAVRSDFTMEAADTLSEICTNVQKR